MMCRPHRPSASRLHRSRGVRGNRLQRRRHRNLPSPLPPEAPLEPFLLTSSKQSSGENDMAEVLFVLALGSAIGGALVWLFKTRIQSLVIDAEKLSARLHAEADAIAGLIRKA